MHNDCRFCRHFSPSFAPQEPWDAKVRRSENFCVVPSKGALVSPWFLLVPKAHITSLSAVSPELRSELNELLNTFAKKDLKHYELTYFEHGAIEAGSTFGCGIDHAHLHIAALPFDLSQAVRERSPSSWKWRQSIEPWHAPKAALPYIILRDGSGKWWQTEPESLPRQFFRRVIADQLGCAENFDYDDNPFTENVKRTILSLSGNTPREPRSEMEISK